MPRRAEAGPPTPGELPTPLNLRFWRLRSKDEIERLSQALHSENPRLSPECAADALSRSPQGIGILREALVPGVPAATRRAAVYGFMWIKRLKPEDFNRLLRIYQDSREAPAIRAQAAEALAGGVDFHPRPGRMRRRDALARQAFLRGLDDPDPEVRLWSIFALADQKNGWLVPKLETMTSDPALVPGMYTVGQEARWAIRWIGGDADVDPEDL